MNLLYQAGIAKAQDFAKTKSLNDAKKSLDETISSASKLLSDSYGKVADNAARDSPSKALEAVRQASGKKTEADPKTYTDAKQTVDTAVQQVAARRAAAA